MCRNFRPARHLIGRRHRHQSLLMCLRRWLHRSQCAVDMRCPAAAAASDDAGSDVASALHVLAPSVENVRFVKT